MKVVVLSSKSSHQDLFTYGPELVSALTIVKGKSDEVDFIV